jgi:hypothetical protein
MKRSHGVPHGTLSGQGRMQPAPADGNTRRKGRYCSTSAKTLMAHTSTFCSSLPQTSLRAGAGLAGQISLGYPEGSPVTARCPVRPRSPRLAHHHQPWLGHILDRIADALAPEP